MQHQISPLRLNHMNAVVEDFDKSVQVFSNLYGAEFVVDLPSPEFHACLLAFGGGIFELFAPSAYLLNARHGPFHLGVEYQADMDEVRAAIAERDIRIIRDIGHALHTHPDDTLGVSFEFYGDYFHDREWPLLGRPIQSSTYWRDTHPMGMASLKGYSIVVEELDAALGFLRSFFKTETVYEESRLFGAGRAVGLQVGDSVIEVLAPEGHGDIASYLQRHGPGIRSTLFSVADTAKASAYLKDRGVDVVEGSAPGRIALPASSNSGLLFEFED